MALTVYTLPDCTQCTMTKRVLDRDGIEYTAVDMSTDLDAYRYVTRDLGYQQAPVVYAMYPDGRTDHWSGFQPPKIKAYQAAMEAEAAA